MHQALYYHSLKNGIVQCLLCPHYCSIANGGQGICRQRKNEGGILYSENYGKVVSVNLDPIEKKPLYHFYPGSKILSIGTNGCNFSCHFCQNWSISQQDSVFREMPPFEIIELARRYNTDFIAYTYNEPFVWYEYVIECMRAACKDGMKNVLVTNGYVNPEPLSEILPYISAINLDIKGMRADFYKRLCGANLDSVLETAKMVSGKSHLEITNLVIPGENDSIDDIKCLAAWIANNLGVNTPLHLSAYSPAYKFMAPPTSSGKLLEAYSIARKYLRFVYVGNISGLKDGKDTVCHQCGNKLIIRDGYQTDVVGLTPIRTCKKCGADNSIKL